MTEKQKRKNARQILDSVDSGIVQDHKNNEFEEAIDNNSRDGSLWNGLYSVLVIVICILISSPILTYPQHDSLVHPEYWYEGMITGSLGFALPLTFDTIIACKFYFRIDCMVSCRVFIVLYLMTISAFICTFMSSYLIWTVGLGYSHPIPLLGVLAFIPYGAQYVTLYFLFPSEFSLRIDIKKKIRAFNISRVWASFIDFQFKSFTFLFSLLPSEWQWILAFLLPLLRKLNLFVMNAIMIKQADVEDGSGKTTVLIGINTYHALYLAISIGHRATETTSCFILAIDFIINLYSCYRIIKMHQTIEPDAIQNAIIVAEKEDKLTTVILVETLEILVPLVYVTTVLIAYYGPNAQILGNIGNSYWQYEAIDDIGTLVIALILMFVVDTCSAIISGVILWKLCDINFVRKSCKILKDNWTIIAVNIGNYLSYVSCYRISIKVTYDKVYHSYISIS